jgi:hypothetical protein
MLSFGGQYLIIAIVVIILGQDKDKQSVCVNALMNHHVL